MWLHLTNRRDCDGNRQKMSTRMGATCSEASLPAAKDSTLLDNLKTSRSKGTARSSTPGTLDASIKHSESNGTCLRGEHGTNNREYLPCAVTAPLVNANASEPAAASS